ncbi:MAG: heavy metal translocating P-type ATPase metal-binding domain-containing protein [Ignavibacteriaceae bacterium]|nr:heavy metal translocating P-type ATPase metal-binding domain-containing protein [Ignavibacteriaceae bacterium]
MADKKIISKSTQCYHCGLDCSDLSISDNDKYFCCNGCKAVYQILEKNNLCSYYKIDSNPGITPKNIIHKNFDYLDDPEIINKLVEFKDDNLFIVSFYIPQMHCSSCIWLLENLFKINAGILHSEVDFLKKNLTVKFNPNKLSLKGTVELLTSIGYEPQINLADTEEKKLQSTNKKLIYKIGITGFCFGNIMLLSFPEYLNIDVTDSVFIKFFGWLNLLLSLPVVLYTSSDYFISAYKGLRKKILNIDVPISLGILVLFLRSAVEVVTQTGAGYFDSMTGLVFFLLLGKLFQNKTYETLNFERNYKSYFPLSVLVKKDEKEISVPISKLNVGDRIVIRNNEIIPADSVLFNGEGNIDYSFVTGESKLSTKVLGEMIYAGGKQIGSVIELEVIKDVSQSYLTQLWNNEAFKNRSESSFINISNKVSKYFTYVILFIASISFIFWVPSSIHTALNVFTAVLIVACPCALALSIPFTLGNSIRIFGRNKFYLKNTQVIERLAKIDQIVFDKTGTITQTSESKIKYTGKELTEFEQILIKSLVKNSTHPLSKKIFDSLDCQSNLNVLSFKEYQGRGIEGEILSTQIKIGSKTFIQGEPFESYSTHEDRKIEYDTNVYISINNEILGYFSISNIYREGIETTIEKLSNNYELSVLSGDDEGEKENLLRIFKNNSRIRFKQSPSEKLDFIKLVQSFNKKTLMIGDGLNDAGALAQSDVGIAVTENISNFSPACDAILDASELNKIPVFLKFSKYSIKIIQMSFLISFIYNIIGLGFAVEGALTPIIAAVLMPVSSISVVIFATVTTNFLAKKERL